MSNLPWLNMYFLMFLLILLTLASQSFPQINSYTMNNEKMSNLNKTKKNKWTW